MKFPGNRPPLRIGELGQRLGVSDHVLRAWENRYGLPQPARAALSGNASTPPGRPTGPPPASAGNGLSAAPRQALDASGEPARLIAGDPVTEAELAGWSR